MRILLKDLAAALIVGTIGSGCTIYAPPPAVAVGSPRYGYVEPPTIVVVPSYRNYRYRY